MQLTLIVTRMNCNFLCISGMTKYKRGFKNTVGKKSIRALEIFRVQKLILNATS